MPSAPLLPASSSVYRLHALDGLAIGTTLTLPSSVKLTAAKMSRSINAPHSEWTIRPGAYTARQIVAGVSPLLNSVVVRLKAKDGSYTTQDQNILIDGLAASLATAGRESTLPIPASVTDSSRKEVAGQASKVGKSIVRWAREVVGKEQPVHLKIRSPCEGHLWATGTASLLLGPRSNSDLMEIYNEWLHQLILLRDVLLPFENFDDVPLVFPPNGPRGLRGVEEPRKYFLLECLTKMISQTSVVDLAKALTAPNLPRGGYGFQYAHGLILPAFLSGSSSLHLLRYHPARMDKSKTDLLFDYEHKDYYTAPRSDISSHPEGVLPPGVWPSSLYELSPSVSKSALGVRIGSDENRRILKLQLDLDEGNCVTVDLGQIARGRRYSYRANTRRASSTTNGSTTPNGSVTSSLTTPSRLHKASTILSQLGLVTSTNNDVHILVAKQPLVSLALLGKLYPENVVLVSANNRGFVDAEAVGKGFGPRFIIYEGYEDVNKHAMLDGPNVAPMVKA
ncbi:MAG: hypothetical protein M1833_001214 [Piccolia ochrophora]|nr:MAG: hypothetical protein M1833_001214 [Piccolia ochrophora]